MTRVVAGCIACLVLVGQVTAQNALTSKETLRAHGIEPSAEGISAFLKSLDPKSDVNRPIHELLRQLASDNFAEHEAAALALARLPMVPESCLAEAMTDASAEQQERLYQVLRRSKGTPQWQLVRAALLAITEDSIKGAAGAVLDARRWIDHQPTRALLPNVLAATATAEDYSRLREMYDQDAAFFEPALLATVSAQPVDVLKSLADDGPARMRLTAARTLLVANDRSGLAPLVKLLAEDDITLRSEAVSILHAVTGQHFGFIADPQRQETADKWSAWLTEHGATAELHLPLSLGRPIRGLISVCVPDEDRVLVLDMQGKLVEELKGAITPKDCERQPSGTWLVAAYKARHLAEYDAKGNRLWEWSGGKIHDLKGPLRIRRLPNLNLLVTFLDSMTVVELDTNGSIVWKLEDKGWPVDAERLDNGLTLVTMKDSGVLAEYDARGQIVWRIDGLRNDKPSASQRLPNGNTLVALHKGNRVDEFDRKGRVVWTCSGFTAPEGAMRLPDGTTVVAESTGLRRVDSNGNLLWHYPVTGTDGLRVY